MQRAIPLIASMLLIITGSITRASAQSFGATTSGSPGTRGLVVLTVSTNGAPESPPTSGANQLLNPPFDHVSFERLGSKPDIADGSAVISRIAGTSTGIFHAELDPGHYRLKAFETLWTANSLKFAYTWPIHEGMSDFEIVAGRVTNLGHLVFHEIVPGENGYTLGFSQSDSAAGAAILRVLPRKWVGADVAKALTWSSPNWPLGTKIRRAIAERSEFVLNPRSLPDGSIVAGSSVGQVLVRTAKGAWIRHDTGLSWQIRAVVRLADGRFLAGGELNTLLLGNPTGTEWSPVRFPFVGLVEWVGQQPDGTILALIGDDKTTTLVRTREIDSPSWVPISQFDNPFTNSPLERHVNDPQDSRFVQQIGDLLTLQLADDITPVVDLRTGAFRRAKKLESAGFRTRSSSIADDGTLYLTLQTPKRDGLARSDDRGESWKAREIKLEKGRVTQTHFATRDAGFRFVAESRFAYQAPVKVQTTVDGGKTWQSTIEMPYLRYMWELGGGRFLGSAEKLNGRAVWITNDAGKSWTREELPAGP